MEKKKKRLRTAFARIMKIKCFNVSLCLGFSNILCFYSVTVVIFLSFSPFWLINFSKWAKVNGEE